MEENLQKVRERLVKEKREKRDKASSLIEVLKKSEIITQEEKEEIREKIIDSFNKKENTGIYEEVNKKFDGVRKIRREIAKINKEIRKEESKLAVLDKELDKIKRIDLKNCSDVARKNMREEYINLLNQKKDIQRNMDELNEKKQKKEGEEKEANDTLGIEAKEIKDTRERGKISITPIETEEVTMVDVSMKEIGKKRWDFFGGGRGIDENIAVDGIDTEKITPKKYYKQKESELRALEENYVGIKERLGEDIYLDTGYKDKFLSKISEKYNKAKEKIEEDEIYKGIKDKIETLKKKLEEMEKEKEEKEKEIAEVDQKIRKIKEGYISDEDKLEEFDLLDRKICLSAEKEALLKEIEIIKEEYGGFDSERVQNTEKKFSVIGGYKPLKMIIGGKMLEVKNIEKALKLKNGKVKSVGGEQVKWGGDVLGEYTGICKEDKGYLFDENYLFCEVGGKPMFWASDKDPDSEWINYKLIWGNDECGVIRGYDCKQQEIGERPCIIIRIKGGKKIVIWGDKKIGQEYEEVVEMKESGGKPLFGAKKKKGKKIIIRGNKQIGSDYYRVPYLFSAGGKPFFVAEKEKDGDYEIIWGDKKLLRQRNYRDVIDAGELGGRPYIEIRKNNGKKIIIWGDKQLGEEYRSIGRLVDVGGKPCFAVEKIYCNDTIIFGDKEIIGDCRVYSYIRDAGGEPGFIVKEKDGSLIMMRGNKQIGRDKKVIDCNIGVLGGKPWFEAKLENGYTILMWGEDQLGKEYGSIREKPRDGGGIPYFIARSKLNEEVKIVVWGKMEVLETTGNISFDYESGEGKLCLRVNEQNNNYKVTARNNGRIIKEKI